MPLGARATSRIEAIHETYYEFLCVSSGSDFLSMVLDSGQVKNDRTFKPVYPCLSCIRLVVAFAEGLECEAVRQFGFAGSAVAWVVA